MTADKPDLLTLCREQVPELEWSEDPVMFAASRSRVRSLIPGAVVRVVNHTRQGLSVHIHSTYGASPEKVYDGDVRSALMDLAGDPVRSLEPDHVEHEIGRRLLDLLGGGE